MKALLYLNFQGWQKQKLSLTQYWSNIGSAGKNACCQSWQPKLIPGIHMVDGKNSYKLSSAHRPPMLAKVYNSQRHIKWNF